MEQRIKSRLFSLLNQTTRVELRDGKRFFGEKADKSPTSIVTGVTELLDDGIHLDLPLRTCSVGHRLEIELEFKTDSRILRFKAKGLVHSIEIFLNRNDTILLRYTHFDALAWNLILGLFHERQATTSNLFDLLKGSGS